MEARRVTEWFIGMMNHKLSKGREAGKTGWDSLWRLWGGKPTRPARCRSLLLDRLDDEVMELRLAVRRGAPAQEVLQEAADVANIAMFLADVAIEMEKENVGGAS